PGGAQRGEAGQPAGLLTFVGPGGLGRLLDDPELIEARTYRFDAHHTFEHAVRLDYRPPQEVAEGRSRDPVDIQGARLAPADRAAVDAEVESTLDAAVAFALASPEPDPAGALDHLYASGLTARTGGG
ncbi:hypothetical protein ABT214_25635, partial [Micromonospora purpureochromogenes]